MFFVSWNATVGRGFGGELQVERAVWVSLTLAGASGSRALLDTPTHATNTQNLWLLWQWNCGISQGFQTHPHSCAPSESGAASRSGELSQLVREGLVPLGLRLVVTSRPEGVKVEDFGQQFVILSPGDS